MSADACEAREDAPGSWAALAARYATLLEQHLGLDAPLREVASYALAGGKRIRPVLAEGIGRVVLAPADAVAAVAVAVEYLHAASVLLDDLPCMDDAATRRGRHASHLRFSEAEAILTAVALTSRSYAILLDAPTVRPEQGRAMARLACETVAGSMAVGQAVELRDRNGASPARVRDVHDRKTASLFTLAARLVVACGELPFAERSPGGEALVRFATLLGRAFQAVDDLEDIHDRGEAGINLALLVGADAASREARQLLGGARGSLAGLPRADDLHACVAWLERRLDAAGG